MRAAYPKKLGISFPHKNIKYKNKLAVKDVHYSIDVVIVPDKECLTHNVELPI